MALDIQKAQTAVVQSMEQKVVELEHPTSLSLADIQMYANAKFGFSAQQTLNICQALYEKHKLTTYPRSDSSYLPEVQHRDAPKILAALEKVNPDLAPLIEKADPSIKSRTWNDKKVTAHHGIIPTQQVVDRSNLSDDELKVYQYIVKRYLAQFYPKCKVSQTKITLRSGRYELTASGKTVLFKGFKFVLGAEEDSPAGEKSAQESQDSADSTKSQQLPVCKQGDVAQCLRAGVKASKTKPPASFNEGTLIKAMENIASVVEDPAHRKFLKEGDGIGTSATRAGIIEELKRKNYLCTKGKLLKCTPTGYQLLKNLPDLIKNPVLTAIFEQNLNQIEQGKLPLSSFLKEQIISFVQQQITKSKTMLIK